MPGPAVRVSHGFPAAAETVGRARRAVRDALGAAGAGDVLDQAELAVSELVTNAVVHAGTEICLRITVEDAAVRVEVEDGSRHLPRPRSWAETAGTGRGLHLVEANVDRWGAAPTAGGKVVWFEIGSLATAPPSGDEDIPAREPDEDDLAVRLRQVPLLMHWAWQEHATTLLREYLLYSLEEDPHALDRHAAASDALNVLAHQLPKPQLPSEPRALMDSAVEPVVTAPEVEVTVPAASVHHFAELDGLLSRAVDAAQSGHLLGPPTQPEISEMREWLCGEVTAQARHHRSTPWQPRTDVRVRVASVRDRVADELARSDEPALATDEASVIVGVTPSVVRFLGYADADDLLGRRILVVVPPRFHQAHIAGTTLHSTHGRDVLLNRWLAVPVVRADGQEVEVELRVRPQRIDQDLLVFLASFRFPEVPGGGPAPRRT